MEWSIAPRIFAPDGKWVINFTLRPLYTQGKNSQNPLDRRLGGLQNQSESGDEDKKKFLHCPCRESNPGRPACSL